MIREVKFESQDRRIKQILAGLNANGIKDIEEANAICEAHGLDPYKTCEETQPICFENAKWAYVVGCAIAIKKGCKNAAEAAEAIGIGLQAFCIPGSVADDRKVGIGHGNLAAMLLREETKCFAFLAGHESFAAAEGAIKIAAKADKVRKEPLRCILNGLGKDAAQIISRINGFTGMDGCLSHDGIQQFLRRVGSYVGQFAFAILVFGDNGPFAEERMLCISQRGGCLGNQEFIPVAYLVLSL